MTAPTTNLKTRTGSAVDELRDIKHKSTAATEPKEGEHV